MLSNVPRFAEGLVNLVLSIALVLLGLRFILRLFAANPDSDFVGWIYATSEEVLAPFRGIFPTTNVDGFVIEFSSLFAMVVYSLLAMLAVYAINALTPPARTTSKK